MTLEYRLADCCEKAHHIWWENGIGLEPVQKGWVLHSLDDPGGFNVPVFFCPFCGTKLPEKEVTGEARGQMELENLFPIVERVFPHSWAAYRFEKRYGRKGGAFTLERVQVCTVDIFWEPESPYANWWNKTPTIKTRSVEDMAVQIEQVAKIYERHLQEGIPPECSFFQDLKGE